MLCHAEFLVFHCFKQLFPRIFLHTSFSFLFFKIICFGLCWVFVAVLRLSLVVASRDYSWLWCRGFSLQWFLLLWSTGSRGRGFNSCSSWALEGGLRNCGAWAQLLCSMWNFPRPGIEPVSLALAGRFLPCTSTMFWKVRIWCLYNKNQPAPLSVYFSTLFLYVISLVIF